MTDSRTLATDSDEGLNRQVVLAARPSGLPTVDDFRLETSEVPVPRDGEVLLRTLRLSIDPYMRQLMDEDGPVYAPSVQLGEPMPGGTVNRVVASEHPGFSAGDLVLGAAGWQDYALSDGTDLVSLGEMARPSQALGVFGMPAFTGYVGLRHIGRPARGETVVVGAATGPVGATAGQLAKLEGARVVGIAGGAEKCRYAVAELGFDICLDRRDPRFSEQLADACPAGIDVYFENVGGAVFDAVVPLLNIGARVPLCGLIADYNHEPDAHAASSLPRVMETLLQKRILVQGLVILDHYDDCFEAFRRDIGELVGDGRLKLREESVDGLENAPRALIDVLEGRNFGKVVVCVADAD